MLARKMLQIDPIRTAIFQTFQIENLIIKKGFQSVGPKQTSKINQVDIICEKMPVNEITDTERYIFHIA